MVPSGREITIDNGIYQRRIARKTRFLLKDKTKNYSAGEIWQSSDSNAK
jgi:hypothetical protein